jgi:tRNA threonylcarbamoyladenosine biosynthesis protein TsaE
LISKSPEETYQIGRELAKACRPGDVLHFMGTLGAGKTTLIQGLVHALTQKNHSVSSPTFIYVNVYEGQIPVSHFDLYRLESDEEFYARALDEYIHPEGVACVEWPEKVPTLGKTMQIKLSYLEQGMRLIEVLHE